MLRLMGSPSVDTHLPTGYTYTLVEVIAICCSGELVPKRQKYLVPKRSLK